MNAVLKPVIRVFATLVCLFSVGSGLTLLDAQGSGATIAGTILDQAGKSVAAASVTVKDTGTFSRAVTTDGEGHFSVTGLAAGTYSIETSSPGFALNSRRGVEVAANGSENVTITLNVDAISNR
jgi:iron complex outermembrane receptor protein